MGVKLASARGLNSIFEPGLVLLNTQTFSAASTISFPDNTFTAAYNAYSFVLNVTGSTAVNVRARLRANGVDNYSANYNRANWE